LRIIGFQPWSSEEFKAIMRQQKLELKPISSQQQPSEENIAQARAHAYKPVRTRFAPNQLLDWKESKSNAEQKPPEQEIRWKNYRYQPNNPRCAVKEIRTHFSSGVQYFGVFRLKPSNMPRGSSPGLYERLSHTTLEGKIGAEAQGWKLIAPEMHLDFTTGAMVPCTAKYRNYYRESSDMRLFGYTEITKTPSGDKVLIHIINVTPHAH
jgi:hypothetical protein